MDASQIAILIKDYGTIAFLVISLLVNKVLFDKLLAAQSKVEDTLNKWREDSQAQGNKLTSILEEASKEPRRRG